MYRLVEENGIFGLEYAETGECFWVGSHQTVAEILLDRIEGMKVDPVHLPDLLSDLIYEEFGSYYKRS